MCRVSISVDGGRQRSCDRASSVWESLPNQKFVVQLLISWKTIPWSYSTTRGQIFVGADAHKDR